MGTQTQEQPTGKQESFTQRKNREQRRKKMLLEARAWFKSERAEHPPFDAKANGSAKMDECPNCTAKRRHARPSAGRVLALIKYYTPDRTEIVRVCLNRWNPINDKHCGYADKIPVIVKADDKASQLSSEV